MLAHTEKGIAEIAYDVGFSNATYFNRLFKSLFGHPPGALRACGREGQSIKTEETGLSEKYENAIK